MSTRRSTSEFLRQAQELFDQALDRPVEAREAWLRETCAGDSELFEEAWSLLAHDRGGAAWDEVRHAVGAEAADLHRSLDDAWTGRSVGVWRMIGILGKGGMGTVYEVARDDGAFIQRAALKIIRRDMDTPGARRRFLEERQILAALDHPHIARLLDGGSAPGGQPYLVMEAIEGQSLLRHAEARRLGLDARLRLAVTAIRAVQYAHQKLIVHRDLKPGNIFVTADGTVKLLDFGIAKLLTPDSGDVTRTLPEQRWLTPDYASPEQLRGEPVGTAGDIYSLGAVLYELVTGQRPLSLTTRSTLEAIRASQEEQPALPSTVAPPDWRRRVRGDLDTVILKALHKEPARRYATAEHFAADLENVLSRRPVTAQPDSFAYRAGKFLRRHALASAAVALLTAALVGSAIYSTVQARRAEKRFAQVRFLANRFLFDFHDSIKDLAGSLPARQLVASTAREYLDGLAADSRGDRDLMLELGAAYEKTGDVLGDRYGANLGQTKEALASYRKALDLLLQATGGDQPSDPRLAARLASACFKVSDGLVSSGQSADAAAMLARGLRLALASGSARERSAGYLRQGDLDLRRADLAAARESFRQAAEAAAEQDRLEPGLASRRQIGAVYLRQGHTAKLASQDDDALEAFGHAIRLNQQILAERPNDISAQRALVSAYTNRGDTLRSPFTRRGIRADLSLPEYQHARDIAARLAAAEPSSFTARLDEVMAALQIADTWRELEPRRGVVELTRALADLERVAALNPAFKDTARLRAQVSMAIADSHARAGQRDQAERAYGQTIDFFAKGLAADPARLQTRRDLVMAYAERGWLAFERHDRAAAARDAAACLPLSRSFDPKKARPMDLRDTARCFELNGAVADPAPARGFLNEAMACWREFESRGIQSEYIDTRRQAVERRLAGLGTP